MISFVFSIDIMRYSLCSIPSNSQPTGAAFINVLLLFSIVALFISIYERITCSCLLHCVDVVVYVVIVL